MWNYQLKHVVLTIIIGHTVFVFGVHDLPQFVDNKSYLLYYKLYGTFNSWNKAGRFQYIF